MTSHSDVEKPGSCEQFWAQPAQVGNGALDGEAIQRHAMDNDCSGRRRNLGPDYDVRA